MTETERVRARSDATSHHDQTVDDSTAIIVRSSKLGELPASNAKPARSGESRGATGSQSQSRIDLERESYIVKHLGSELSLVRSQHAELERQVQEANVAQRQVGRGAPSVTPARRIDEHRVDRSRAESASVQSRRAATRVFAESEEVDGKAIVDHFNDFVDGVNDLLFCVTDKLEENELTAVIQLERVLDLAKTNGDVGNLLHAFITPLSKAQPKFELVALHVMQATSFRVLCDYIFCPTLSLAGPVSREVVQGFEHLRKSVASSESQEKYGRWRTITYGAMRKPENDNQIAQYVALEISRKLEHILFALLPATSSQDNRLQRKLSSDFPAAATKLVLDAIKLQDKIQRVYISHDYSAYLPTTNDLFSVTRMVPMDLGPDVPEALSRAIYDAHEVRGTVLLPALPDLRAMRVGQNFPDLDVMAKKAYVIVLL